MDSECTPCSLAPMGSSRCSCPANYCFWVGLFEGVHKQRKRNDTPNERSAEGTIRTDASAAQAGHCEPDQDADQERGG